MVRRRDGQEGLNLTNGPAKLCQALGIDKMLNGHDLQKAPLRLIPGVLFPGERISQTTRIGITRAVDVPWRFYISDNRFVSKPH
jgi:DNA-3-methyladenine glycosylase